MLQLKKNGLEETKIEPVCACICVCVHVYMYHICMILLRLIRNDCYIFSNEQTRRIRVEACLQRQHSGV